MSDDVIDFDAARKAALVVDEPRRVLRRKLSDGKRAFCLHRHYTVSMHEAEVECSDCGAALDVWEVLRQLATHHESTWHEKAQLDRENAKLRADIRMLKEAREKLKKGMPKSFERITLEPDAEHRWRIHFRSGRMANARTSPWMTQLDAQRFAAKYKGRVEEWTPPAPEVTA